MAKKNKVLKRISPCSAYDIAGTEQWLEEMAAQGFHLCPDNGFMLGIGRFEVGEPKHVKYRLEAASARMALFEVVHWNTDVKPNEEALQIYEEMGWEYVTNRLAFHVYRSTREDAREFNTDPVAQAEGLKSAGIRLLLLLLGVVQGILRSLSQVIIGDGGFFYSLSSMLAVGGTGSVIAFLTLLVLLWIDLEILNRCIRFYIYWRKVKSGKNVRHTRKATKRSFFIPRMIVLGGLWVTCLVGIFINAGKTVSTETSIQDYTGPIPFATLVEAFPDGTRVESKMDAWDDYYSNKVRSWSDLIAPENYEWSESYHFLLSDGTEISASYDVTYHRTKTQFLAELLVKEQKTSAERSKGYLKLDTPEVEVDYVLLYDVELGGITLVMQDGSQVVVAEVSYTGMGVDPGRADLDNWVTATAEGLLDYAGEE